MKKWGGGGRGAGDGIESQRSLVIEAGKAAQVSKSHQKAPRIQQPVLHEWHTVTLLFSLPLPELAPNGLNSGGKPALPNIDRTFPE